MRAAALERRAAAHDPARGAAAVARLLDVLAPHMGRPVSGYMPMRSEIDPLAAMAALVGHGPVGVPVIEARGAPLAFHRWTPGCAMRPGPFGAQVPDGGVPMLPEVLIVPLLAFDRTGARLGYGGGFYDRTLAMLRARGPVLAVGLAYAAQEVARVPVEPTDQLLDAIVTEDETIRPALGMPDRPPV
ncbi:5-formyltetrahydrofolate cyclo-ligase [Rhodovulum euryhalinum]|uniref:5-formyltetrahydrofolate cyclo-ligase n=1 Tax=Rhodovulum euryhalinum TaxID=35805 RepID=A0A4R2KJU2_9RHOB|nr:5-formyltetrahydrofolate cyclo-ligase [Rhodovulum euryhalinum]TCO70889.1 5-formyltetrahydrofolate cyclo-ligase [Rhodovulum euryhalinum]